jgi:CubicO group peptidase (beta-lactamase class C family)
MTHWGNFFTRSLAVTYLGMTVGGTVSPGFERVRDAFAEGQAQDEGGAQLCIYRHGKPVVDLWTGRDPINNRPYTNDTIAVMMSCTKGAVATAVNMLIERGLIDVDAPVARYWPEFKQGGKEKITIRHLLTHEAGLTGYEPESGIGAAGLLNWKIATEGLARMAPLWEPGTAFFYHFITFGFLLGEVVRRVTDKSFGRFFADEIAGPLKLDMWIGLPQSEEHRVAPHFSKGPQLTVEQWKQLFAGLGVDVNSRLMRTVLYAFQTTDEAIGTIMNSRAGHEAEIPAGNGIGNARSLAKMYAALIGEVDGVRLISPEAMEKARAWQTKGLTAPGDMAKAARVEPQRFGLGFELARAPEPMLGEGSFGHAGAGGRMGFAHPESGFALGYVCNNMLWNSIEPDPRWVPWTEALLEIVRKTEGANEHTTPS